MIAYHFDSNTIIQSPFANRKDKHRIKAYMLIMKRLSNRVHKVDVQILDNEVGAEYKRVIVDDWGANYQLVTPNVHWQNKSEKAICTFKGHFLSVLAGVVPDFPKFMWDNFLGQTDLTLNLILQATLNPHISAWEYFNSPFDYAATPLGPIGCKIIIHTTSKIANPGIKEDVKDLM